MSQPVIRNTKPAVFVFCAALAALAAPAAAQLSTTPQQGLKDRTPRHTLIVNARVVTAPGSVIENGSIELRDGVIRTVRAGRIDAPGATVVDAAGKSVFPAFVDAHSDYGIDASASCRSSAPAAPRGRGPLAAMMGGAAPASAPSARHWNDRICAERDVSTALTLDADKAKTLRRMGFGAVLATPGAGVLRGQSALLSLRDGADPNASLLAARVAQHASFEADFSFSGAYPGSKMGAIALIRQALIDARWQSDLATWNAKENGERAEANVALEALSAVIAGQQPLVFRGDDELDVARVGAIAAEFDLKRVAVLGVGTEYRVLDQLPRALTLIAPLNFPDAPNARDAEAALDVSLAELEHWHLAPSNAARLAKDNRRFILTTAGLKKPEDFWPALRKTIKAGLDEDDALRALTTVPAELIGQSRLGAIRAGAIGNLFIADRDIFSNPGATVYEVFVDGQRDVAKALDAPKIAGRWQLTWLGAPGPAELIVSGSDEALALKAGEDSGKGTFSNDRLTFTLPGKLFGKSGEVALEGTLSGTVLQGRFMQDDGRVRAFSAARLGDAPSEEKPDEKKDETKKNEALGARSISIAPRYPAGEFGRSALPNVESVVIRGATVWMADDVPTNTDVVLSGGKIVSVAANAKAPAGAVEIDGTGKHLTPGLIDAHSHIAVSGNVNEPSHAITSEVRLGDVIDPTDIDIYRELAGGTTTSHVLHGSANPIGGQSQLIKHRWGAGAQGLKFEGWTPTIKFALGENVKQSNWGAAGGTRYPQTRMGVEQILLDAFAQARTYAKAQEVRGAPQRRDLRMEALAEILAQERLVHIHSYRQDEILMYARLSQSLGLPVAAFQHVLEGYKVADVLAQTGAGASTFSDWWGFKMEVVDGIPYNAAMMVRQGVVVSINSDSNDLGRRLNTEAAKAVKYGNLSETQALALVTTGPAKQLRVDDRIGRVREGMHADLVLWNAHPLSSYARPERVWIDGRRYFDVDADRAEQLRIDTARAQLLQLALAEGGDKSPGPKGPPGKPRLRLDVRQFQVLSSQLEARRGAYHDGEAVHYCQGAH